MQSLVFQFQFNWTKRFFNYDVRLRELFEKNIAEAQKGNIGILK